MLYIDPSYIPMRLSAEIKPLPVSFLFFNQSDSSGEKHIWPAAQIAHSLKHSLSPQEVGCSLSCSVLVVSLYLDYKHYRLVFIFLFFFFHNWNALCFSYMLASVPLGLSGASWGQRAPRVLMVPIVWKMSTRGMKISTNKQTLPYNFTIHKCCIWTLSLRS